MYYSATCTVKSRPAMRYMLPVKFTATPFWGNDGKTARKPLRRAAFRALPIPYPSLTYVRNGKELRIAGRVATLRAPIGGTSP